MLATPGVDAVEVAVACQKQALQGVAVHVARQGRAVRGLEGVHELELSGARELEDGPVAGIAARRGDAVEVAVRPDGEGGGPFAVGLAGECVQRGEGSIGGDLVRRAEVAGSAIGRCAIDAVPGLGHLVERIFAFQRLGLDEGMQDRHVSVRPDLVHHAGVVRAAAEGGAAVDAAVPAEHQARACLQGARGLGRKGEQGVQRARAGQLEERARAVVATRAGDAIGAAVPSLDDVADGRAHALEAVDELRLAGGGDLEEGAHVPGAARLHVDVERAVPSLAQALRRGAVLAGRVGGVEGREGQGPAGDRDLGDARVGEDALAVGHGAELAGGDVGQGHAIVVLGGEGRWEGEGAVKGDLEGVAAVLERDGRAIQSGDRAADGEARGRGGGRGRGVGVGRGRATPAPAGAQGQCDRQG